MGTSFAPKKGCCSKCGQKGREHATGNCGVVLNADGTRRLKARKKKARKRESAPERGAPISGLNKKPEQQG